MADEHKELEGRSLAAWTGVGILVVAAALIGLGIMVNTSILWIIGVVLIVVGLVAGKALAAAGFGVSVRHQALPGTETASTSQR